MNPTTALEAMQAWPIEQQLEFLFCVWDQVIDSGWQPELTEELRSELDRRLAAYQADPGKVLSWEEVVAHVRRPQ